MTILLPRTDLAGLPFADFHAWSRALVGHDERFHRALYRRLMTTGRFAPDDVPLWREAESSRPGVIARLRAGADEHQHAPVVKRAEARDPVLGATLKLVSRLADGQAVESVLIPMRGGGHWTLCVSSQVGCRMGCTFCRTARMGLVRDLAAHEIVGQVLTAIVETGKRPRNVVFMGMGEPLDNLDAVARAVDVLVEAGGLAFAHRHITISTVGRVDGIARLPALGLDRVNLAVSVTSADDAKRSALVPVNRVHGLAGLKAALVAHPLPPGRRILASYVLIAGINDSETDAQALAAWLAGLRALVNLIPFNPFPESDMSAPTRAAVTAFRDRLDALGVPVRLRLTKGDAVLAACGQLGEPGARTMDAR